MGPHAWNEDRVEAHEQITSLLVDKDGIACEKTEHKNDPHRDDRSRPHALREIPDGESPGRCDACVGKGVISVSTTHAPPVHAHRLHFDAWHVAVVVLAAALVALAAWVVIDNVTGGDSATSDATALIDDFSAAASANDGATAMTMMTDDAVLWSNGDVISGAAAWADAIDTTPTLTIERTAPVSVEGEYATTFALYGVPGVGLEPTTFVMVYQLRDGKVARLWAFLPGTSEPMDNIAP